jgi:Fe-coproporphyrin III synthase
MGASAAIDGFQKLNIMPTPRSADLEITSRCNLRCKYCYYFDNKTTNYFDLPTEDWLHFFDELGRCAVMNLCLAGGEPFIREDLPELLNGIVRNRMRFSILSNGSLISDDIASFIANTGRCNYVQVSVDGSIPEIHDSCRGKGSFIGAINGIRILQEHHVPIMVRVTIHHYNFQDLEKIAKLLLDDLNLGSFSTNSATTLGSCHGHKDVVLTTKDRSIAIEEILRLSQKYNGRISASAGPLAQAETWRSMEMAQKKGSPGFPNGGCLTSCGCASSKIAVRSDGIIVPCSLLSHIELGRINRNSLIEIWQKSSALNRLRSRRAISLASFEFCDGCSYMPYCTGGCPASAYNLLGEIDHPSPDDCLRRFLADGGTTHLMERQSLNTMDRGCN